MTTKQKKAIENSFVAKEKEKNEKVEYLHNINHHLHSNPQTILFFQSIYSCH